MNDATRSGLVTFIGKPNVGKSTLLNRLVGQKLSITSTRAQTTRHRLLGIKTTPNVQIVYVDTPGLHKNTGGVINRHMNRIAGASVEGVNCIVLIITASGWTSEDEIPLRLANQQGIPVILAINKIDKLKNRALVLPLIETSKNKGSFAEIVPISARSGTNLEALERAVVKHLPVQSFLYPEDQISDRSDRFLVAELIREQIFRSYQQEIPYASAVQVDKFRQSKKLLVIEATIWVEKEGQKPIVIGKDGLRLKTVGSRARLAIQKLLNTKVNLQLWVKVREGWSDSERALQSLGYSDDN